MATRVSRGRQSTATPGPSSVGGGAVPQYQPPSFPLNANAQRALAMLLQKHDTRKLGKSIEDAQSALAESAVEIYDKLQKREERVLSLRRKYSEREPDVEEEEKLQKMERELSDKRKDAHRMNDRIDQELRKLIDTSHGLKSMQDAVKAAETDARNNASTQASTQGAHNLRTRRSGRGSDGEDGDEEDNELPDFTPTDPAGGTQPPTAPRNVFIEHMDTERTRYQGQSLGERYADNQTYQDYRRAIHDAQYPDDEVPLPPQSQWFNEGGAPAPGVTTHDGNEEDSDDDIAIARTTTSTKCPLTLQEFKNPLSSKLCRHIFENDAIIEMIQRSTIRSAPRPGHRGGQPAVQCPVGGCQKQLTRDDLHVDKITTRKIKRIQEARRLREEGGDDDDDEGVPDGTQRRAHVIDSEAVDLDDDDGPAPVQPKREPRLTGGASTQGSSGSAPRSTRVIDLGESEDEEDDEDMDD